MPWSLHGYKVGASEQWFEEIPRDEDALDGFITAARRAIEPWLSAVFQSEHLNLLLGSGFTAAVGHQTKAAATGMGPVAFGSKYDDKIDAYAKKSATAMGRGSANIEDQLRGALMVLEGLKVIGDDADRRALQDQMDAVLLNFLGSLLSTERAIAEARDEDWKSGVSALQSFLLSFASRAASRERLHVFTTNYERLIEYGCDLAGLRIIDRFVGALNPVFRSTRVDVDMHYNPPGIRGEPRFMEGVIRLTKLHGSLDWHINARTKQMHRVGIPFGAGISHSDVPKKPIETVMIYPNPAKDVETTAYPYAELFRDFAAALCRPNSVLVIYGYGFGDDHVNRVLLDMLSIPSTHIVIIAFGTKAESSARARSFYNNAARPAQISLLVGEHFAHLENLVTHYLPKPAIDFITSRMAELLKHRPSGTASGEDIGQAASIGAEPVAQPAPTMLPSTSSPPRGPSASPFAATAQGAPSSPAPSASATIPSPCPAQMSDDEPF
ncbi:fibronectin-binding protein (FBP) [Bordetella genomosp. 9]|uniref:Fibronectin-binding protein (FBP) n=1 Tax=Bordetella genomosp. 9 TaxID=1416803 RepID=A0A261RN65_9BORD|nr:SIR2 family protein [Bordetella genomosp. 9]OZI26030.1 fibronectin-binding protein (FBP) [Bordetella genomosp. 9]